MGRIHETPILMSIFFSVGIVDFEAIGFCSYEFEFRVDGDD